MSFWAPLCRCKASVQYNVCILYSTRKYTDPTVRFSSSLQANYIHNYLWCVSIHTFTQCYLNLVIIICAQMVMGSIYKHSFLLFSEGPCQQCHSQVTASKGTAPHNDHVQATLLWSGGITPGNCLLPHYYNDINFNEWPWWRILIVHCYPSHVESFISKIYQEQDKGRMDQHGRTSRLNETLNHLVW